MTKELEFLDKYPQVIPGVYDVPNEEYHAAPGISSSNLRDIYHSIDQYEWYQEHPKKPTDAMIEGSALHDLALLPDKFDDLWYISKYKTKTAEKFKKDVEDHAPKGVLTAHQGHSLTEQYRALKRNPTIVKVFQSDTLLREVSIWGHDPTTNLLIKARPDIISMGVMYDLKTTAGSVTPRGFLQSVYKYKYHVQAAWYLWVAAIIGMQIDRFVFICVERHPPYHTALYELNDDLISEGRMIIRQALDKYHRYKTGKDDWTGLDQGREVVVL